MPEQFTFEEATEPESFSFEEVQEKPEVSGPPPESTPFPGPYGVPMGAWEQPLVTVPPKVTETGIRALMHGPPNLSQLLWLVPKEKREQIIKGAAESLAGGASSISSPGGLGMVAGAAVAPEIFIPAMVGYGETQLPAAIEEVSKAETAQQKAKAWMDLAQTAGMVLGPVLPGAKAKPEAKPKAAEPPKITPEPPEVQETIQQAAAVLPEAAKEAEKPSKTLEDIVGDHNKKVESAVESNLKAAGTEGGVELQSTEWPDVKMLITPDIAEPGKWRATRIDKHGPVGHQVFDSREAAIRAYSGESFTDMVKGPSYTKPGAYVFSRIVKTEKPAAPAAQPKEPNAIPEQTPDAVHVRPAPGDRGAVGEGVRPPVEEAPGAKAEAPAEALNPTQMADAVGGVKFDAEIDYKLPGKPPMWQFTLTTKGRESTIYVPKGTTVEELRAKVATKNAEYDAAEGKAAPPSVGPRGAEKPAASSTLAASSVTPVAGGERASSAAARQGEVGTGSATSQAKTDPRLMSDADIASEIAYLEATTSPLYDKLEAMGDKAFQERSSKYTPEAKAIHDQIDPFARRRELLQFEAKRRAQEIQNKIAMDARDKRVSEAPVFQLRNGWEIVKEGVDYVLRDPTTKEDVYRGKLKRVREVADESKPPLPEGPGALTKGTPPTGKSQIEELTDAFRNKAPVRDRLSAFFRDSFDYGNRTAAAKDAISRTLAGMKRVGDKLVELTTSFEKPDDLLKAKGVLSADIETRGWRVREFAKAVRQDMPDKRRRAAVSKWIEAGGDTAELQRGERETKPQFKQAYRDAQRLTPDEQIKAQNISNYFDSRLQEAIDAGVLENGLEDYIHRIYERAPVLKQRALAYVQSGLLSKNPSLAKKRMFEFDWEAEKAGFVPVQDFLSRVADYETSLSKAIAARAFIGKMAQLTAPDGRPVIGIKGVGVPVEDQAGVRTGTIIKPLGDFKKNANPADAVNYRGDYVNREYNALSRWKWIGTDTDGKPIFLQGDVAIHPDFVGRVDALLKPSQIRYGTNPKLAAAGRAALGISSTFKQTMLDLSGFHQVQIAVHGLEHRVWALPGKAPPGFAKIAHEIDFADPNVQGLLKGGVTLGGEYHASHYGEGLFGKSISQHIPVLGPVLESYHSWLFQDFIPRVKMTMALHALERNRGRFRKDLASGKMTEDDLMFHTAKQANAAFGELNYIMSERSKTVQDMARIIMLAPDFLEARAKFAAQGLTKYGTEQRVALLLGATTLWALARVANYAINGQPHNEPENLFSVVYKNNAYSLRTVQGDILHAATKPIQFWLNRLNPVYTRSLLELISKRDQFGRKRDFWQALGDTVSNIVPISLRSSRERHLWESILNSMGVTARRFSDVQTAQQLAQTWKTKNNVRQAPGEFIYDADKDPYRGLKIALSEQDDAGAVKEIKRALDSKAVTIPQMNNYFERYARAPFTGSQVNERKWLSSLSEDERKTVESARQHRLNMLRLYHAARAKYLSERKTP